MQPVMAALLLLLLAGLAAGCDFTKRNQTYSPLTTPMIVFSNPTESGSTGGLPCSKSLTYDAYSGTDTDGLGGFRFVKLSLSGATTLVISDGYTSYSFDKTWTLAVANNKISSWVTASNHVTVTFTEADGTIDTFILSMVKGNGFVTQSPTTVSPSTTTTPPYVGPFEKNPRLISDDIAFVFDTSNTDEQLQVLKDFASSIVDSLNIGDDTTLIKLLGITQYPDFKIVFSPTWNSLDADKFKGALGGITPFGLEKKSLYEQLDSTAIFTDARHHATRFVFFFSSNGPSNTAKIELFNNSAVHPILIQYNMEADDLKYFTDGSYKDENSWSVYKYDSTLNTTTNTVNFINTYLLQADQICQVPNSKSELTITKDKPLNITIPQYYKGAMPGFGNWTTPHHYCNYQDTTITIHNSGGQSDDGTYAICFNVYYELESGKDFVKIINGHNVELVTLTGFDVSGAQFEVATVNNSLSATIRFTADNRFAFDGFYATITDGPCPTPSSSSP